MESTMKKHNIVICSIVAVISLASCASSVKEKKGEIGDIYKLLDPPLKDWQLLDPEGLVISDSDGYQNWKNIQESMLKYGSIYSNAWTNNNDSKIALSVEKSYSIVEEDSRKGIIFALNKETNWLNKNLCKQTKHYTETKINDKPFKSSMRITEVEAEYTCEPKDSSDTFTLKTIVSDVISDKYWYSIWFRSLEEYYEEDKYSYYELRDSIKQ